jgi:hypothetical protein
MRIDNQRNTYRIWIRRLLMAISFTVVIIILIFVSWFDDPELWLTEYHVIVLVALIYVVVNILLSMKAPYFIAFSDHGEMILLRYYPLNLFNSKKHSIEIPKQQFVKYELKSFFFGRHQKIILYQHFRNRVVGYPPISLSALEKDDRDRMLASLQKYIQA